MSKSTQENRTVSTVRLGLDKIKTKEYGTGRFSTYTTRLRLYETKVVTIREKTSIALRVWQGLIPREWEKIIKYNESKRMMRND